MERFGKIQYTLKHRKSFLVVEKQLLGRNTFEGRWHDFGKIFLYLLFGVKLGHKLHQILAMHHVPNCMKSKKWIIQAIIDWECARFTKPDKPLNARDTLIKYYNTYFDVVNPVLIELGL